MTNIAEALALKVVGVQPAARHHGQMGVESTSATLDVGVTLDLWSIRGGLSSGAVAMQNGTSSATTSAFLKRGGRQWASAGMDVVMTGMAVEQLNEGQWACSSRSPLPRPSPSVQVVPSAGPSCSVMALREPGPDDRQEGARQGGSRPPTHMCGAGKTSAGFTSREKSS